MNDQTPPTKFTPDAAYYQRANETGELLAILVKGLGAPLHAVAIIGAKMVAVGLEMLVKIDRAAAIELRDELAEGFLTMITRLEIAPEKPEGSDAPEAE